MAKFYRFVMKSLMVSLVFLISCAESSKALQIYGFAANDNGAWVAVEASQLENFMDSSKVTCSKDGAIVEVVWNSESGDWAAFDTYRSKGEFFSRVIRFAQFDGQIVVSKSQLNSDPVMRFGDDELKQYDFLISDINIWNNIHDAPFPFPECANQVFSVNQ